MMTVLMIITMGTMIITMNTMITTIISMIIRLFWDGGSGVGRERQHGPHPWRTNACNHYDDNEHDGNYHDHDDYDDDDYDDNEHDHYDGMMRMIKRTTMIMTTQSQIPNAPS